MSMIQIRPGDTLGKLVAKYNRENGTQLTVAQVAQANGLRDANKIQAGRQLIFPDKFEQQAPQQTIRNGQGDQMVRNGVRENVTIDSPQLQAPVADALNSFVERRLGGDFSKAQQIANQVQESGSLGGNDDQLIAGAKPELRAFYDDLRKNNPALADSLLLTMREVAQAKGIMPTPKQPISERSTLAERVANQPNRELKHPNGVPTTAVTNAPQTQTEQSQELLRQQRLRILP